ncbi:hypothetical protein AAVH_23277 [Aphelenchoides avenae]|nr:hypothetical protein AAVH_23277 [Aphelenchus avenae]
MNFEDAKKACQSHGGSLAAISTPKANAFLSYMSRNSKLPHFRWIGLYAVEDAPCRWAWLDNTPMDFRNWEGGVAPSKCADVNETDMGQIADDAAPRCAGMNVPEDDAGDWRKCQWSTSYCFEEWPAICQTAPIVTTIQG